jgi:hypothetical protein
LDKKFPKYAKKMGPGKYQTADGEVITGQAKKDADRVVLEAIIKRSVEWYNDPTSLLQETFYGLIEHETGTNGTVYPKVKYTRLEKPEEALVTESFTEAAK